MPRREREACCSHRPLVRRALRLSSFLQWTIPSFPVMLHFCIEWPICRRQKMIFRRQSGARMTYLPIFGCEYFVTKAEIAQDKKKKGEKQHLVTKYSLVGTKYSQPEAHTSDFKISVSIFAGSTRVSGACSGSKNVPQAHI